MVLIYSTEGATQNRSSVVTRDNFKSGYACESPGGDTVLALVTCFAGEPRELTVFCIMVVRYRDSTPIFMIQLES